MAYSDFNLQRVKQEFGLTTFEQADIFQDVSEINASQLLNETLKYNLPPYFNRGMKDDTQNSFCVVQPTTREKQLPYSCLWIDSII